MYFKLSIRNAKRSIVNYLLYITTMTTLLSIMEVSKIGRASCRERV